MTQYKFESVLNPKICVHKHYHLSFVFNFFFFSLCKYCMFSFSVLENWLEIRRIRYEMTIHGKKQNYKYKNDCKWTGFGWLDMWYFIDNCCFPTVYFIICIPHSVMFLFVLNRASVIGNRDINMLFYSNGKKKVLLLQQQQQIYYYIYGFLLQ